MKKTLILGVGSILRGDDGIGICVIDRLDKEGVPDGVHLQSGDISGIDLLKYFSGHDRIIIIDAAEMKEQPGTIKVFNIEEIKKSNFSNITSTHGITLLETLTLMEKLDMHQEIVIIGIQPQDISLSMKLTPLIEKKIHAIIHTIQAILDLRDVVDKL